MEAQTFGTRSRYKSKGQKDNVEIPEREDLRILENKIGNDSFAITPKRFKKVNVEKCALCFTTRRQVMRAVVEM